VTQDLTSHVLALTGDGPPPAQFADALYHELHRIAHRHLSNERQGHTLSTTALVHEAYLRLVDAPNVPADNRARFLATASNAMRRILVDYARARNAEKRGGGARRVELTDAMAVAATDSSDTLLALDAAMARLCEVSPRLVELVECRFFGGMTEEETAAALGIHVRTVRRDWLKAKGWLAAELG
jgi:RNA polymerase sigma factor (TIGR02999 family)